MANTSIRQGLILLLIIPTMAWSFIGTITTTTIYMTHLSLTRAAIGVIELPKGVGVEMDGVMVISSDSYSFDDDTQVMIGEHSELYIDDFVYDPSDDSGSLGLSKLALGTVRYASGQIAKDKPQAVKINKVLLQLVFVVQILQQQ